VAPALIPINGNHHLTTAHGQMSVVQLHQHIRLHQRLPVQHITEEQQHQEAAAQQTQVQ
jgi:hypothetical protein